MQAQQIPDIVIRTFRHYYEQLVAGETGLIPEADIEPVIVLPDAERLPDEFCEAGQAALPRTLLIKLNGGLGTSMGMEKAKSLLKVKDGLTFLDIITRQALHSGIPLVLMNSFNTRQDSLEALADYPDLRGELPLDFVQHMVPKVRQDDLSPALCPSDPDMEWNPPGHGDIYTALITSGRLAQMLDAGYEYAFVSNSDNLGAVIETRILGYFAESHFPFMMEVADRTIADRKGGHLAQMPDGRLLLRESAQCPPADAPAFQDIQRHRYFNSNNLWLHLPTLSKVMAERENVLGLPLIRNAKTIDPRDPESAPVYQIETAMGAAISIFDNAGAIRVPRSRFAPVKTTSDLLAIRSDAYVLTDDYRVILHPDSVGTPDIILDPAHYLLIDDMEQRFAAGAPSLRRCRRLRIQGDVCFEAHVTISGEVDIVNPTGRQARISSDVTFSDTTISMEAEYEPQI
ncbi:MAG: UTP--glucose-1-phosphate uridylyltransferase [Caldilineales bacterium]|nr:UTP--glucose-1-phosphate uridylyltransferase [Caldilineales bacterium]